MHIDFTINPIILRLLAMITVIIVIFIAAGMAAHYNQAERLKVPAGVIAVTLMIAGLYSIVALFV
jgi:hypothetical protein